jgi:hypothetical protein
MDGGRLASIAAVLAVAGVAVASLADSRGSGGPHRASTTTARATTTTATAPAPTTPSLGSLADQLGRLPAVTAGELRGRIHRRLPTCRWRVTDLATGSDDDVTPRGRCPLWVPGWRYAFSFAVEQSASAPIVRGIDVVAGTREVGRIRVPEAVTGGAAGTPGGRLALCLHGLRDETRLYTGARLVRIVPSCDPVSFGEEFLFQDGGRFRDADGRVVIDLGRPPVFVQPTANGLVVAVTGDDRLLVYRGRKLLQQRKLPDGLHETDVLDADADRDGGTVALRIRRGLASDLAVIGMRGGDAQESHAGSVQSVWIAPDGRSVAAVVAGVPIVLDATTLIPRGRLTLEDGASLQAWTS